MFFGFQDMAIAIPKESSLVAQQQFEARYHLHGQSLTAKVKAGSAYEVWLIVKGLHPMASIRSILEAPTQSASNGI